MLFQQHYKMMIEQELKELKQNVNLKVSQIGKAFGYGIKGTKVECKSTCL